MANPKPNPAETRLMTWLEAGSRRFPDKVFLESLDQDRRITYGELYRLANRIAHFLKDRGIGANDRVALLSENSLEQMAAYFGVMCHGATVCTIHVEMNAVYFGDILNALKPALTLYAADIDVDGLEGETPGEWMALGELHPDGARGFFGAVADLPEDPLPPVGGEEDDAVIFYTSGTESRPKGVVMNYREAHLTTEAVADMLALTEADRILEIRAMNWFSAQIFSGYSALSRGATVLLARKFSHSRYFDWVRDHKATIGVCNPTGLAMFLNRPVDITAADVPHLRFMTSSSAPLSVQQWQRFEEKYGIPVAQGYGASEIGWIAGTNEHTRRHGTVGKPFACHQFRIIDAEGNELPQGEIGEGEVGRRPDSAFRHFTDDGSIKVVAVGRMRTGDLGFLDEDGYLHLTGRARDLIIRGGVNISPAEIDDVLLQMPDIAEAATVGVPDAIYGEEVVCFVVPRVGRLMCGEDVLHHCRNRLPDFRMPKQVFFRDSLPKTERGKMSRAVLVEEWRRER